jgi:hypothetical protein
MYETLHDQPYGILIAPDRRRITAFVFDPNRFDIELSIELDAPISGMAAAPVGTTITRLVMADGGSRFINDVNPGIPTVATTRAALLASLDQPAIMTLGDTVIEPVVQRLADFPRAASGRSAPVRRARSPL